MSDSNNSTSGGVGFAGLLTITFIVLKLTKVIGWSWWWVLSPSWIPAALVIVGFIIYGAILWRKSIVRKKRFVSRSKDQTFISQPPLSKWEQRMKEMQEKQKR